MESQSWVEHCILEVIGFVMGRAKPSIATQAETWMYLKASSDLDLNFATGSVLMTGWTVCC